MGYIKCCTYNSDSESRHTYIHVCLCVICNVGSWLSNLAQRYGCSFQALIYNENAVIPGSTCGCRQLVTSITMYLT